MGMLVMIVWDDEVVEQTQRYRLACVALARWQVIAAAARVVVSNCHDCVLHLGTPRPPMLTGDCRFVRLAPFNTRYERQVRAQCMVPPDSDMELAL
jgi:hypothetical protein